MPSEQSICLRAARHHHNLASHHALLLAYGERAKRRGKTENRRWEKQTRAQSQEANPSGIQKITTKTVTQQLSKISVVWTRFKGGGVHPMLYSSTPFSFPPSLLVPSILLYRGSSSTELIYLYSSRRATTAFSF